MSRKFLSPVNLTHGSTLPASGNIGDLFYKSDELKIYVYDGISWVIAQGAAAGGGGVTVSATPPAEPTEGDYWFDSTTSKSFIFYDGYWIEVGYSSSGFMVSATAPVSPTVGDTWFNSTTGQFFIYYDSFWVELGAGPAGPAGPQGEPGVVTNYIHPFFF